MLLVNDLYCDCYSALHVSSSFAHHQELILNGIAAYLECLTVFAIETSAVCRWQLSYIYRLYVRCEGGGRGGGESSFTNVGVILLLSIKLLGVGLWFLFRVL
jgi:hypothetical protein